MKNNTEKKIRRRLKGIVVSDKMDKTVVVQVRRFTKHSKYGKFVTVDKKYKAHDADNAHKAGDEVIIEECRPISKSKTFKVV